MKQVFLIDSEGKARKRARITGMAALAASMIAPLRRQLNYQGLARKVFHIQQIPQGALPIYDKDVEVTKCFDDFTPPPRQFRHDRYHIDNSGKAGRKLFRVMLPTFEIYSNPTIKIADVKQRRFDLIDRNVQAARRQLMSQEDTKIFEALDKIAAPEPEEKKESFWCEGCGEPRYKCYCDVLCKHCGKKEIDCSGESESGWCPLDPNLDKHLELQKQLQSGNNKE